MAKKRGRMRYYAIHSPAKFRGVYYDSWANVQSKARSSGAVQHAFDQKEEAEYYVLHGHVRGVPKNQCLPCEEEKKKLIAHQQVLLERQHQLMPRHPQHAPEMAHSRSVMRFQEMDEIKESKNLGEEGTGGVTFQQTVGFYYAVVKGVRPGVYDDWDEAKKQIDGFRGYDCVKFPDRTSAVQYLRTCNIPDDEIRLFRKTFKSQPNFTPNPTASFKQEFQRFASSQQMPDKDKRKARVDAIRDEIIQHFLPEGIRVSIEQDDEEGYVELDDDQTLKVFQAMCRRAGKPVLYSIDESLMELKGHPYVNILDFVDTFRTGKGVRTFEDWFEFKRYTRHGRMIDMESAKHNEFLAPLLQDLVKGPNAVDPRIVRRRLVAERDAKRRQRYLQRPKNAAATSIASAPSSALANSSLDHHRSLSPSNFDRLASPFRTPTPDLRLPSPGMEHIYGNSNNPHIKSEPSAAASYSSTFLHEVPSPETDYSDFLEWDELEQYIKPEPSEPATDIPPSSQFKPMVDLNQDEETSPMVTIKPEPFTPAAHSSFVPCAVLSSPATDFSDWDDEEQCIKEELPELAPVVYASGFNPVIDLTPEERPSQVKPEPFTTSVSLGKRPRKASPRAVVPSKRSCTGKANNHIFYDQLSLTQKDMRGCLARI